MMTTHHLEESSQREDGPRAGRAPDTTPDGMNVRRRACSASCAEKRARPAELTSGAPPGLLAASRLADTLGNLLCTAPMPTPEQTARLRALLRPAA